MKTEVIVNGVTLTRQQVETALQELNAPEPPTKFSRGDIVEYESHQGVVLAAQTSDIFNEIYGSPSSEWIRVLVIGKNSSGGYTNVWPISRCKKVTL